MALVDEEAVLMRGLLLLLLVRGLLLRLARERGLKIRCGLKRQRLLGLKRLRLLGFWR